MKLLHLPCQLIKLQSLFLILLNKFQHHLNDSNNYLYVS